MEASVTKYTYQNPMQILYFQSMLPKQVTWYIPNLILFNNK